MATQDLQDLVERLSGLLNEHLAGWKDADLDASIEFVEAIARILVVKRELFVQGRKNKTKEKATAGLAEFQRQVVLLAPSLLNLIAKRDEPPNETDKQLLDTIVEVATEEDMQTIMTGLESKSPAAARILMDAWRAAQARKRGDTA